MGRLGCRVAATGLLSALPRHSSCSIVPIPMPSSSPISIPGAAVGEYLLGLGCQGCSGACSTPFSRLLQPSVRGVVDLEVMTFGRHPLPYPSLCGRVTLSVGVHSVCAPVSKSGGLTGLLRSPGSVHSNGGSSASRPFFASCSVTRSTSSKLCALALSTAPPVFTWVMAPVSALLHSLGIRMRRYLDTWLVQSFLSGVSPRGSSTCPPTLSGFWDCHPSQVFQPHAFPGGAVSVGSSSIPPLSGLLRRWNASLGGNLQPPYLCHAPRLPRACASLLGVLSSLAHLVPGG